MTRSRRSQRAAPAPCDPRSPDHSRLKSAWAEFLGRWTWEWFCTLTFVEARVHPERAEKCFRVWLSKVNAAAFGRKWRRRGKGVLWARGAEYQRRGSLHYHVLIARVGEVRRLSLMDEWAKLGGWARIRPVQRQELVRRYVAKYVAKGGEIDVGGPGPLAEPDPRLL